MDKQDWSEQFKALLASPLGIELIRTLREDLHDSLIEEAESVETQEKAYALLNRGAGVIKTIEHLQFLAVVPTDEDSKESLGN